jgi:hypothetical protein
LKALPFFDFLEVLCVFEALRFFCGEDGANGGMLYLFLVALGVLVVTVSVLSVEGELKDGMKSVIQACHDGK